MNTMGHSETAPHSRRGGVIRGAIVVALIVAVFVGVYAWQTQVRTPTEGAQVMAVGDSSVVSPTQLHVLEALRQEGNTIGSASAPVQVTIVSTLECNACQQAGRGVIPALLANQVASGEVQLTLVGVPHPVAASSVAARYLEAAGRQNRLWDFLSIYDANVGGANGTSTTFLKSVVVAIPGLNQAQFASDVRSSGVAKQVTANSKRAAALKAIETPTYFVGASGSDLTRVQLSSPSDSNTMGLAISAARAHRPIPTAPTNGGANSDSSCSVQSAVCTASS